MKARRTLRSLGEGGWKGFGEFRKDTSELCSEELHFSRFNLAQGRLTRSLSRLPGNLFPLSERRQYQRIARGHPKRIRCEFGGRPMDRADGSDHAVELVALLWASG